MDGKAFTLTIVSISYNNFDNIQKHVESIMKQDFIDYELIFQDDGSSDYDSDQIKMIMSEDYIELHSVRFYHNDSNVGTVRNLNKGIANSHGCFVMPIAVDDYFAHDHVLSAFMNEFQDETCNVCTCMIIGEKSKTIFPSKKDAELTKHGTQRELLDRMYASNCMCGALLTFRKDYFIRENLFDTRFMLVEDYPTFLKLIHKGERIKLIEEVCLVHGEDGISNRISTLFNKNKVATQDSKLIKDIYVMPYLSEVKNKRVRRYVIACYYLRYHKTKVHLVIKLLQYFDIWIQVALYYLFHSKSINDIYYYLAGE